MEEIDFTFIDDAEQAWRIRSDGQHGNVLYQWRYAKKAWVSCAVLTSDDVEYHRGAFQSVPAADLELGQHFIFTGRPGPNAFMAATAGRHPHLTKKHEGMRMSLAGLLRNSMSLMKGDTGGYKWALGEFEKHINEMAQRFYAGDIKVVDEFCQLYCLDEHRPKEGA